MRSLRLFALLSSLLPGQAFACSCHLYDSLDDARARALTAVEARVVSVERRLTQQSDTVVPPFLFERVHWRVISPIRGALNESDLFTTDTLIDPPSCGVQVTGLARSLPPFQPVDRDWLLFFNDSKPGHISTCSRSMPVRLANKPPTGGS